MKKIFTIIIVAAIVLAGVYVLVPQVREFLAARNLFVVPQIKQLVVSQGQSVTWPESEASFNVLKIIPRLRDDKPHLQIYCRWDNANIDGQRFELGLPKEMSLTPLASKNYIPGISFLKNRDFVIFLFVDRHPSLFSQITIPITCKDKETGMKELGTQTLRVRYWPTEESGYSVDTIQ